MYILLQNQNPETIPVCRLCGIQCIGSPYVDILGDNGRFMAFAIQKYLEIEVSDKETYSKSVCHCCSKRVEEWNDFYNKCHEMQSLFKNDALLLDSTSMPQEVPSSALESETVSNHLSKLVEELVQESTIAQDKTVLDIHGEDINPADVRLEGNNETHEMDAIEEDQSLTEDEFEEELTSDNENDDLSDDSADSKPKQKPRQKKFIFTIPFLEKKLNRTFSQAERAKLQKHISKRQNILICEYALVF